MTSKVARNASWIIGCKLVQSILGFVLNMLTARFLGKSSFGDISYAMAVVSFVVPLMRLGFGNIMVQEIVQHPEREGKAMGTGVFLNLVSAFACIAGVTAFAFVANPGETETVIICALYGIKLIFEATDLMSYWYQAKLMAKYSSVISLIVHFVVLGYKIFLLVTLKSVYWFAVTSALEYLLCSVGMYTIYHFKKTQKLSISLKLGKELIDKGKHYILSSMMVMIFAETDKIMLKGLIDSSATALYSTATILAGATGFFFAAIIDSFRPWIFEVQKTNEELFKERLKMLYSFIIYLSLLQSIVMTVFAKPIVLLTYGEQYAESVGALQIVVWYTTFSYLGSVRNIWILANDKQKYLWVINLFGAGANVVLNVTLIPFLGIYGAAIASLVTQIFTNVIVGYILKPIRPNNAIMVSSLNPNCCLEAFRKLLKKEPKVKKD
ncbi:MAG: flippase [Clostridiales bacterium]|nr:flippase [Clostridiales bacterium]